MELGVSGGSETESGKKWRDRFSSAFPNREIMIKVFVTLMVLIILVTFILTIVNAVRICRLSYC